MKEFAWRALAWVLSRPFLADRIIVYSKKTPYFHLRGYMNRWWVFNPYQRSAPEQEKLDDKHRHWKWLPSIRVHHILREDRADHLHDHPWDARTIILKGGYKEQMEDGSAHYRSAGSTRAIRYGEYHHIQSVEIGGAYTLFFTWKYMGTWGFKVNGSKIPCKEYIATHPERS